MDQAQKLATATAAQRNEKVRAVLLKAEYPLSPREIATRIREPWCHDGCPKSAEITPVCRRIGATSEQGRWSLKADGA